MDKMNYYPPNKVGYMDSTKIDKFQLQECLKKSIYENFVDYCHSTNLHGFHQIIEQIDKQKNPKLRSKFQILKDILWTITIIICLSFGFLLLFISYDRYQTTPTITTIETNNYGIWHVPFPSVTICNINSVSKPQAVNITRLLTSKNISLDRIQNFYESLNGLIVYNEKDQDIYQIYDIIVKEGYDTVKLMQMLAQPCSNLLKSCKWVGKVVSCATIFRRTRSDLGYCCSFNYKALKSLLELGVSVVNAVELDQITSPVIHVSGAGEEIGLTIVLNAETENYLAPKKNVHGTEIIVHDSENYPEKTLVAGIAQPGYELIIGVDASVIVTDESVRSYPVELKFCRYDQEKILKITKKYSHQSCITDCRIITILKLCNCLPFFYPFIDYLNIGRINRECTVRDIKCLAENKHIFASLKPPKNSMVMGNEGMICDCVPSCLEQSYSFETYTSQRTVKVIPNVTDDEKHLAIVKIHFKDLSVMKYRREIFMTWDTLFAAFGGIFGLCLGGSIISLIEIFYYSTFKLFTKYLSNKNEWFKQHNQFVPQYKVDLNYNEFNKQRQTMIYNNQKLNNYK